MEKRLETFSEILNDLVIDSGLSLRQIGINSGIDSAQYSRYLHGSYPSIPVALRIALYFDCTLDYLFGVEEKKGTGKYKTAEYDIPTFLKNYQELLRLNKTTHYQLAKKHGFSEAVIRGWKYYGKQPSMEMLVLIANELSGSIDELIGRK